jgi:copper transport protein
MGGVVVPVAGTWRLVVTVRTDDIDEATVQMPITIR